MMIRFRFSRAVIYGGGKVSKAGLIDDLPESEVQALLAGDAGRIDSGESPSEAPILTAATRIPSSTGSSKVVDTATVGTKVSTSKKKGKK
jgi:hypothetical protein